MGHHSDHNYNGTEHENNSLKQDKDVPLYSVSGLAADTTDILFHARENSSKGRQNPSNFTTRKKEAKKKGASHTRRKKKVKKKGASWASLIMQTRELFDRLGNTLLFIFPLLEPWIK